MNSGSGPWSFPFCLSWGAFGLRKAIHFACDKKKVK